MLGQRLLTQTNRLKKFVRQNKTETFLLLLILLLAAFLRLYRIADYLTFLGDEGRDVLQVKRIIVDHKLTLLGPTSSVGGFFLGPFYYYLMIPFLWAFGLNPVGPAVMVALFGVATVFLVYLAGRDFFQTAVGLLAALLYAISPLVIGYSRSSWNPNLMPFFSLLIIYLLWRTTVHPLKKNWLVIIFGVLFGLTIQLHYLAVFLLVVFLVYFWFYHPLGRQLISFFWLAAGFLLGWSPLLLFELRHNFPNFRSLYHFLFFGKETGFSLVNFFPTLLDVGNRLWVRLVANNEQGLSLFLIFLLALVLSDFFRHCRKYLHLLIAMRLLLVWLAVGVMMFGFYQDDIFDYYLGFLFPLPFLLTAFALVWLVRRRKRAFVLSSFVFVWLLVVNLRGIPFRYEPNRQLSQARSIARFIFDQASGHPFNFALITGGNSDHAYRYFFEIWGNPPVAIENEVVDPDRETVTKQLWVVCESLPCFPLGDSLWEIAGFGRAEITGQWPVSVVEVYRLEPWEGENGEEN